MTAAWFGAVVATTGLIGGWFVLTYQRLTEKLTEDRRAIYGDLLAAADLNRRQRDVAAAEVDAIQSRLVECQARAHIVATPELFESDLIDRLVRACGREGEGDAPWRAARENFVIAARLEGQKNSLLFRWTKRTEVYSTRSDQP